MQIKSLFGMILALFLSGNAWAWSENGHETVGKIADQLIDKESRAGKQITAILGTVQGSSMTLQQAAIWADCARGIQVERSFVYDPGRFRTAACAIFEDDAGKQAMKDYVMRNNTNCVYKHANLDCHKSFHFADIAIQQNRYSDRIVGAPPNDVVHAIGAAIAVLKGNPCPSPFRIATQKEALMLLAHFVGDIHQPLHVGAVYLQPDGAEINPDTAGFDKSNETAGGNLLFGTGGNLHHQWDETKYSLNDPQFVDGLLARTDHVGVTAGPLENWAAVWAGDTLAVAKTAFDGVSFAAQPGNGWAMSFDDRRAYLHAMRLAQEQQVIKGGTRLAQLLKAIWPN